MYLPQSLLFHLILHTVYTFRYFIPLCYGEHPHNITNVCSHFTRSYILHVLYTEPLSSELRQCENILSTPLPIFSHFHQKTFPVNSTTDKYFHSPNSIRIRRRIYLKMFNTIVQTLHTHSHLSIR